jgi:hypothetical protein
MDEPLSLRMTDQHEILRGDVSISHVVSLCNHNRPGELGNPDGNTIRTMRSKGIRILADLVYWHRDSSRRLVFNVDWSARRHGRWTDTQKVNWGKIVTAVHSMPVQWLFDGSEDLLASCAERREWAEANIRELAVCCALQPLPTVDGNRMRMLTWVHDTTPPPDYPYTRALSAHSAVIQLYARSGQLPTAETLESRLKLDSCMCRLGCLAVESMHHIFVDCTLFTEWREDAANELVVRTTAKLVEAGIPGEQQQ